MVNKLIAGSLGERIRTRRKSIGMTQADLASAIGVSFQQVQKYEKGLTAISAARLQQICQVMHLPPRYFDEGTGDQIGKVAGLLPGEALPPPHESVDAFLASGEGRRLVESFASITDQKLRTRILDFIALVATDQP